MAYEEYLTAKIETMSSKNNNDNNNNLICPPRQHARLAVFDCISGSKRIQKIDLFDTNNNNELLIGNWKMNY